MDKQKHNVSIQTEGANNVLILELQENDHLIGYCCKILEHNKIPGLLPMRRQNLDGTVRLRYNINGKVPLGEFMRNHSLTYKNGVRLLKNLTSALQELGEYFLTIDMCYLDPEQIYVGDGLRVYIPCVPIETMTDEDSNHRLKQFYEELLSRYFATCDCDMYDNMFKWVYKSARMDLQLFAEKFLQEETVLKQENTENKPQDGAKLEEKYQKELPQADVNANKEVPEKKKGESHKKGKDTPEKLDHIVQDHVDHEESHPEEKSAGNVVVLPSGGTFVIPGQQKKKEEKAEKSGLFSFLKWDKNKTEEPKPKREKEEGKKPDQVIKRKTERSAEKIKDKKTTADDAWTDGTIYVENIPPKKNAEREKKRQAVQPYLVHNGQNIPIQTTPFLIGTYNTRVNLNYAIYDNGKVSRNHATILLQAGKYYIRDNQSRNGTLLNGQLLIPLQMNELHDGDEIKLYDEKMTFYLGVEK